MKTLKLANNLTLPLESVTQTIGVLAKRRAGKSYAARRFAEQLFKAGQQLVIIDPKGDWYGVRASADGKKPGLPIVILGGERGDVPLEVNAGEVVGKLVVEERVSVLLDLSLLRKHEVATFMADFLESLYRLKAREQYRTPLMLIVDEADAIAPQSPKSHGTRGGNVERMLGAAEDIVRRGGQRGIGCTLITQRSAVLNKNVLTQIQMLVVLRTISPQDLAAIDAWIDVHGTEEERKILKGSLPALPIGDAWFWSPGWPTLDGIFERVHILPIETFDSGATPKPGEKRVEPKSLADVDLNVLKRQMAATIERAKAENPKELRRQIAELQKQLKARVPVELKPVETVKEVPAVDRETVRIFIGGVQSMKEHVASLRETANALESKASTITSALAKVSANGQKPVAQMATRTARPLVARTAPSPAPATRNIDTDGELGKCERTILAVLSQFPEGCDSGKLTLLSGYRYSGGFKNSLSNLRSQGLIVGANTEVMRISNAGLDCGPFPALPEGEDLIAYWLNHPSLGVCERTILKCLTESPDGLTADQLCELTGYRYSGGFKNSLSKLRTAGLLTGRNTETMRASDHLFG